MILSALVDKYNVAAPRYTSYPTVPYWDNEEFEYHRWQQTVQNSYTQRDGHGISVYIHLPFCESLCTYCGCNTRITKNHQVEQPYINAVLKEWGMYKQLLGDSPLSISEIHLGGGTPTFFDAKNLERLIAGILEGNKVVDDASFSFEAHPANTSEDHLKTLYNLGFRRLSLGIQDFDPRVQFAINRKQTVEDVERVMYQARAIGYESINFDLIYGLPLQTIDSVRDTVSVSMKMSPDRISFYSYAHVPWIKPGQRHFTEQDLPEGNDKLELYKLGKHMILDCDYHDVGMDHFAKKQDPLFVSSEKGALHRNFMGYTDRYTPLLIGLGVSSISDAWMAFAQNAKTVETYYSLLEEEKLPVVKGHILSDEDALIRRYILDMMCRGYVDLVPSAEALNQQIKERLLTFQSDGLVLISAETVQVTELGKSFLRNICTAFDMRMHDKKRDAMATIFSQAI